MRIIVSFVLVVLVVFFGAGLVWWFFLKPPDVTVSVDKYFAVIGGIMSLLLTAMTAAIAFVTFRERVKGAPPPVIDSSAGRKRSAIKRALDAAPYSVKSGVF